MAGKQSARQHLARARSLISEHTPRAVETAAACLYTDEELANPTEVPAERRREALKASTVIMNRTLREVSEVNPLDLPPALADKSVGEQLEELHKLRDRVDSLIAQLEADRAYAVGAVS